MSSDILLVTQRYELFTHLFEPTPPQLKRISDRFAPGLSPEFARVIDPLFSQRIYFYPESAAREVDMSIDGHITFAERFVNLLDYAAVKDLFLRTWRTLSTIAHAARADVIDGVANVYLFGNRADTEHAYALITSEKTTRKLESVLDKALPQARISLEKVREGHGPSGNGRYSATIPFSFNGDLRGRR